MSNSFPLPIIALALIAIVFGGIPYLRNWILQPKKTLFIHLLCIFLLLLWFLYRYLKIRSQT